MRYGWNNSPVSTGRLYAELWDQIRERDWSLVSADIFQSSWANKLWPIDRYYQHNGSSGSAGIGYGAPARARLGARAQAKRRTRRERAEGRRPDVLSGHAVDRCASPGADAHPSCTTTAPTMRKPW